jgi:hypothetical protein
MVPSRLEEPILSMDEKNRDDRRQFLRCGLTASLTALAAMAAKPARAQDFPKATKEQAGYQDAGGAQPCSACTLFVPPTDCKVVQGPVSENGTCTYFTQ